MRDSSTTPPRSSWSLLLIAAVFGCGGGGGDGGSLPSLPDSGQAETSVHADGSQEDMGAPEQDAGGDGVENATLALLAPIAGACVAAEVEVVVQTTLPGSALRIALQGSVFQDFAPGAVAGTWRKLVDLSTLPEGEVSLRVDAEGASSDDALDFTVWNDRTAPVMQVFAPTDGALTIGEAWVDAKAYENSPCGLSLMTASLLPVAGGDALLTETLWEASPEGEPLLEHGVVEPLAVHTLPTGSYQVRLTAEDAAGWTTSVQRHIDIVKELSYVVGLPSSHGIASPRRLRHADHDGDALLDIYVAGSAGVSVARSRGTGKFWPAESLLTADSYGVEPADLNGDGATDFVAVVRIQGVHYAQVFLHGESGFELTEEVELGKDIITQTTLADITGDGHRELIVTTASAERSVGVVVGIAATAQGDVFMPGVHWAGGVTGARDLAIGDFNNDGKEDVIVGSKGNTKVSVFLGTGNGEFLAAADTLVDKDPVAVATVSLGDDSYLDIVVASESTGDVRIHRGQGNGYFTVESGAEWLLTTGGLPTRVMSVDMDKSGKPEVIATFNGDKTIVVHHDVGEDGTSTLYACGPYPLDLAVGRFTDDDIDDLVVLNGNTQNFTLLPGTGGAELAAARGLFQPAELQTKDSLKATAVKPTSMAFGHFDAMPGLDILAITDVYRFMGLEWVYDVYIYPFSGTITASVPQLAERVTGVFPNFVDPEQPGWVKAKGKLVAMVAGDFDANQLSDIAIGNALVWPDGMPANVHPVNVDTLLQKAPGTFELQAGTFLGRSPSTSPDAYKKSAMTAMLAAKFDADARDDLVVAMPWVAQKVDNTPAELVSGVSTGTGFDAVESASPVDANAASNPGTSAILADDINLDGIMDLVTVNLSVDSVGFHYGLGNGEFLAGKLSANVAPNVNVAQLQHINADEDDYPDLVSVGQTSLFVSFGVPEAAGVVDFPFTPPSSRPYPGNKAESVVAADLNGDGLADLAIADSVRASLILYLNIGGREFAAETLELHTRSTPREVRAIDLDEDGCLDLVVRGDAGFTVLRNAACE